MSRTYRLRNLPRFTAKKYVDGRANLSWRRQNKIIDEIIDKRYPEIFVDDKFGNFGLRWQLRQTIERENPYPAECVTSHPWVSWCRIGNAKTWYKQRGNRWARRRSREILGKTFYDETYDDGRSRMPTRRQEMWDIWSIC